MNLDPIGRAILNRLQEKHSRREELIGSSRHLTQHAAQAIRAIHRGEMADAEKLLEQGRELLEKMNRTARDHPDLESAGYTLDSQKEYAEAWLTRALLLSEPLPGPEDLDVEDAAWLNGLGEAAGELRRAALERIRKGASGEAESLLTAMEEIHSFLSTVDFPGAVTRNIKRTNDMVRAVTERTRGDLAVATRQEALQSALERFEARVSGAGTGAGGSGGTRDARDPTGHQASDDPSSHRAGADPTVGE